MTTLWLALALVAGEPYEIADLQALVKSGDFATLVAHLDDIRPSKRGADWDHLVEAGASGLVDSKAKDPDAYATWQTAEALAKRYPSLASSKAFLAKLRPLLLTGGQGCYALDTHDAECNQLLLAAVQRDPDASLEVGKLVIRHQFPYFAVTFFAPAVEIAKTPGACEDEALRRAVLAAMALPEADPKALIAERLSTGPCWKQFKAELSKELGGGGYFKANACAAMKAKKLLDDYQTVQCEGK